MGKYGMFLNLRLPKANPEKITLSISAAPAKSSEELG
jgi:NAD(P)H-flavin reductase